MILTVLLYIPIVMVILFSFLTLESFAQWTIPNIDSINKQKTNFATYESNDSTLKIDYPSDWTISEKTPNEIDFRPQTIESGELVKLRITPLS